MSRAFVSESDSQFDDQDVPELKNPLPPGARNYMTPEGAGQLREELRILRSKHSRITGRVSHGVSHDGTQNKSELGRDRQRLRELQRQIDYLMEMTARIEVVDPQQQPADRVLFGATVTVKEQDQVQLNVYRIVGVPESNPAEGKISWISPLAKALLSKTVGDIVTIELPGGNSTLEIIEIKY